MKTISIPSSSILLKDLVFLCSHKNKEFCHAQPLSAHVFSGLFALLIAVPSTALARIKLITLPVRQRVEIQLDNPHATLVEEERIVPLVKGVNQVDFSWANTQIDPNTIIFRVIPQVPEAKDGEKPKDGKAEEPRHSHWMSKSSR